jgi:transposase-like protein
VRIWPRRRRQEIPRKRHTPEQIIAKLRQVEIEMSRGKSVAEAVKAIGVTDQTYYRWRKEYGGLRLDQARRLKELERENARLKRIVADQSLDISILKEAAEGNR